MLHGQQYEAVARQTFMAKMGLKIKICGLFIDSEYNYLAAYPNGIVGETALIEIKCPFKGKDRKIVFLLERIMMVYYM